MSHRMLVSSRAKVGRLITLVVLGLATSILGSACGGVNSPIGPGSTDEASDIIAADGSGFNEAQFEGQPTIGGSITFGVESTIASLDPAGNMVQPADLVVGLAIYDPLIRYDENGQLSPGLATAWESTPDLKTWTITTRSGVRFHDGTPFNAQAVQAQFDRLMDPATNCRCLENLSQVRSVRAESSSVVVFDLVRPNAFWPNTLAATAGWIASPTATAKYGSDYARHPVGTGPYSLPDYDSLLLRKNTEYWRTDGNGVRLPYLDEITISPIPDARTRLLSLRTGDIDIMQTADTSTIVDALASETDLRVQKITGSSATVLMFNLDAPPFNDPRIRRAFAHGLNRDEINQVQYQGTRQEAVSPFNPASPYFADTDMPTYDPEKARALVAEAKADGVDTTYQMLCIPTPESRTINELVAQQMKRIGLTQESEFQDQGAFVNRLFTRQGDYQAACFRSPQVATADDLYSWYHSDQGANMTFYSVPEVDEALDGIRRTSDSGEHVIQLRVVQEALARDLPVIPMLHDLFGNVYRSQLSGLPVPEPWTLGVINVSTLYLKK